MAQAINLEAQLEAHDPPPTVQRSLKIILTHVMGGRTPPLDLIVNVQVWLGRQHQQNRWGK